jgi:hypothetical protein
VNKVGRKQVSKKGMIIKNWNRVKWGKIIGCFVIKGMYNILRNRVFYYLASDLEFSGKTKRLMRRTRTTSRKRELAWHGLCNTLIIGRR